MLREPLDAYFSARTFGESVTVDGVALNAIWSSEVVPTDVGDSMAMVSDVSIVVDASKLPAGAGHGSAVVRAADSSSWRVTSLHRDEVRRVATLYLEEAP